ncbi:hypothetical protein GUJ93_ZPchr0007g4053 [Zizania palustris]|uniref:Uncharacterized protein n=1 Tax=Zizania palustris TaxID=103762 RepID=A0A8J5VRB9_ZIZPA|nr:hypothetical protein GUJ93_ZPchr0007g4053 [Zizania palustris]
MSASCQMSCKSHPPPAKSSSKSPPPPAKSTLHTQICSTRTKLKVKASNLCRNHLQSPLQNMARQSKRTCAPVPKVQAISSTGEQPIPLPAMFGTAAWCPPCAPRPRAPSSSPYWLTGIQHPNMASSASQGTWWGHPSIGASANHVPSSDNLEDSDLQAWGSDSHPPGGFINFLNNAQVVSNGNSSQPIHIGDDINDSDSARTEKRLLWTKEEDLRLLVILLGGLLGPSEQDPQIQLKSEDLRLFLHLKPRKGCPFPEYTEFLHQLHLYFGLTESLFHLKFHFEPILTVLKTREILSEEMKTNLVIWPLRWLVSKPKYQDGGKKLQIGFTLKPSPLFLKCSKTMNLFILKPRRTPPSIPSLHCILNCNKCASTQSLRLRSFASMPEMKILENLSVLMLWQLKPVEECGTLWQNVFP